MYKNKRAHEIRLFICLIIAALLLIFDSFTSYSNKIRNSLSLLFVPSYYVVNTPVYTFNNIKDYFYNKDLIIEENRDLKIENLKMRAMLQKLSTLEQENNRLRNLLKSSAKVSDKLLVAELLSVVNNPASQQFVLNQGSNKSVFVGQAVIDANGIIGQVVSVTPVTSRVLLITDVDHAIPVEVLRNNMRAIAVGMGDNKKLELLNISNTADIIKGDVLVSSGLGERFPEGYPVGKVVLVDKNPMLPFAKIIVEPFAKLDSAKEALLVWPGSKVTYSDQNVDPDFELKINAGIGLDLDLEEKENIDKTESINNNKISKSNKVALSDI